MLDNDCVKILSSKLTFWDKLTEEQKNLFCRYTSPAVYEKGENIHGSTGNCTGGILIKSGCVRTYMLSDEGKEITLYRLYPGDICMLSASCVIKAITFDVFIDAEEKSEVFIINSKIFSEISEKNIYVENFALNIAAERFSDVIWAMQQILFMSFDKRLAIFLSDEAAKTGSSTINLTHEQIAKYMGSAREVVSRMLKYFASEGIVELYRGGIKIVDMEKLIEIAE
jgi:CRP/FNR family transcriptional regulator